MPTIDPLKLILISLGAVSVATASTPIALNNVEINSLNTKIEKLYLDKKKNRSIFLPELALQTGVGSEKLLENDYESEKGPMLFLDGKINLYRGGRDLYQQRKIENDVVSAKIEKEIKSRSINIEAFKLISEIELLTKESALLKQEVEYNKNQEMMARKKVNAGLTTSVDLLDFDIKRESLLNDLERNTLKKLTMEKELNVLFAGKLSLNDISNYFINNKLNAPLEKSSIEDLPEVILRNQQVHINNLDKKSAKAEYLPSVDFNASWGHITPQRNLLDNDKEHQVALLVSFPIFSGFSTDYNYQQAVLAETQAKREFNQAQIDLESKKDTQLKQIEVSKKILQSLERLRLSSKKYLELTISEYKRGVKNSPDVISASDRLLEIERKILETENELLVTHYSFNETFKPYKEQ